MARKNKKPPHEEIEVTMGSGNIFADLRLPNPEEHLAKAKLASQICLLIREAGLTQAQAAERLGIDQPKISLLMRGILKGFSIERLMRFLNTLDCEVTITLGPPRKGRAPTVRVMELIG